MTRYAGRQETHMIVSDGGGRQSRFGACHFGLCDDFGGFGLSPGLNPAPNGTFTQILATYPESTILAAICWAGWRKCDAKTPECQCDAQGMANARAVLQQARLGFHADKVNYVEDAMAYAYAAGYIVGTSWMAPSAAAGPSSGGDVPGTSALEQGLSPAPKGNTFNEALANYSVADLVEAIAWAEYGNTAATGKAQGAQLLSIARGGDVVAMATVTRSLAYWYAFKQRGGDTSGAAAAAQAAIDAANKACAALPFEKARAACRAEVEKRKSEGEKALDTIISKYTGSEPGKDDYVGADESSGIPWWGFVVVAAVAAKVFRVW